MISIKTRQILLTIATIILCAFPLLANAACPIGQFDFGSGCVKPSPDQSLLLLRQGNQLFASGDVTRLKSASTQVERTELEAGQNPYAIVLTCSDSRVSPEILFDRGLGEMFTVRVAGNIVAEHELGSIEYAVEHLGTNLIVVLGHEKCGAVKATYDDHGIGTDLGPNLNSLISSIDPAVTAVVDAAGGKATVDTPEAAALIEECIVENISRVTESLEARSTVLKEAVENGTLKIVQAKYDLDDGLVRFFNVLTPASISVPKANSTGAYMVSWSAVDVAGAVYVLEESVNGAPFVEIYSGTNTSFKFTGVANGTYNYRVKAVKVGYSQAYQTGNSFVVFRAIAAPTYINVPASNSTGRFAASWAASEIAGTTYVFEGSKDGFATTPVSYAGANTSYTVTGLTNGTYVFRVRAINGALTSTNRTSGNCVVSLSLTKPSYINIPATNSYGRFGASWGASAIPGTTYVFEGSKDGFATTPVSYAGANTSYTVTGLTNGTYVFRVRAINGALTSADTTSGNCVVNIVLPAPAYITVPATSSTGRFSASWAESAVAGTTYEFQGSKDGFATTPVSYSGANRSYAVTGLTTGTYVFRVRTTNGSINSLWTQANVSVP